HARDLVDEVGEQPLGCGEGWLPAIDHAVSGEDELRGGQDDGRHQDNEDGAEADERLRDPTTECPGTRLDASAHGPSTVSTTTAVSSTDSCGALPTSREIQLGAAPPARMQVSTASTNSVMPRLSDRL